MQSSATIRCWLLINVAAVAVTINNDDDVDTRSNGFNDDDGGGAGVGSGSELEGSFWPSALAVPAKQKQNITCCMLPTTIATTTA